MTNAATEITSFGTAKAFTKDACSGTLMGVLDRAYGHPMKAEEAASNPLAGGIVQHGYQCGQLWGSALAAGAQAHRLFGPGPRAEAAAVDAARRLVESFRDQNHNINCLELTDSDMQTKAGLFKYFIKGGPLSCGSMAVRFAPLAFEEINDAMAVAQSGEPTGTPSRCASCAAKVARMMGASDEHVTMAAGLAGGIGLSGGGCGALGAAIWITGMNNPHEQTGLTADGTKVGEVLDTFMVVSDHRLECFEIAGREFKGAEDHARYLEKGGCAEIIETLAAVAQTEDIDQDDPVAA